MFTKTWISTLVAVSGCSGGKYVEDIKPDVAETGVAFHRPEQITAGSESNFAPDLSPNGAFVVYTSDRKGNKDIWEKRSSGGFARPLTLHPADDFSPVISPDGDRIAFVSRREDAAGDIYVVKPGFNFGRLFGGSKEGALTVIQSNQTEDTTPSWYPDGDKIVFAARRPGEPTPQLMVVDLEKLNPTPLGEARGDQPSVSPEGSRVAFIRDGAIFIFHQDGERVEQVTEGGLIQDGQPRFTQDGKALLFIRYADDTNQDGQLNGDDRPTLWRIDLEEQAKAPRRENYSLVPLTSALFAAFTPQIRSPYLYMALQTKEGLDIFRLPESGQATTGTDLEQVRQQFDKLDNYFEKTYVLRRAQATFHRAGQEELAAETALQEIDWQVQNRKRTEATWAQAKLAANFPALTDIVALSELAMVTLDLAPIAYPRYMQDLTIDQRQTLQNLMARADAVAGRFPGDEPKARRVRGAAALVKARLLASQRSFFDANALLAKTITDFGDNRDLAAEAALFAAQIAPATSDMDTAIRAFRTVVKDYPENSNTVLLASKEAVALLESHNDRLEALASLRVEAAGLPIMPALAHMRISEIFMEQEKAAVAANELRMIVDSYPESPEITLQAAERLSFLEEKANRYEAAEAMLHRLNDRFKTATPEHAKAARNLLVGFLLRRGESLLKQNEPVMAIKEYDKVVALDPLNVSAHRGIIDGSYMKKETGPVLAKYERESAAHPESAERRYFYGYALTYAIDETDTMRPRIAAIDDAIEVVEEARTLDSQLLHIHQTLGWLYLQKGFWVAKYYDSGSVLAKTRQKGGMLRDFFGSGEPSWLELAIDAFQTAYFLSQPESLEEAGLTQNLGQTYFELKNYQKSLSYYMQRIRMLPIIPMREPKAEALLLRQAGRAAFQTEEFELAESLQRSALTAWETINDDEKIAYSIDALALTLRERGRFKDAITLYERLRRLNERVGARTNLVGTLSNLGYCAYTDGQYDQALTYFAEAEKELLAVQGAGDEEKVQSADSIQVDLGGGGSAAKGFDLFARHNLILTFRGKIYEKLDRPDLATEAYEAKLAVMQKHREKLIDDDDKPDSTLAAEISVLQNNIADLRLKTGFHDKARDGYKAAADTAKLTRAEDQAYMSAGELINTVNHGRVQLRLAALDILPAPDAAATAQNLEREADALRPVYDAGSKAEGKPLAQILSLSSTLRLIEDGADSSGSKARAKTQLEESWSIMGKVDVPRDSRDGVLLAYQGTPDSGAVDGKQSDVNLSGLVSDFRKQAMATPALEWKIYASDDDAEKAFEALDRYVYGGGTLKSPTDRRTARIVMETLLEAASAQGADDRAALLLRRYLLLRETDLVLRAAGVMSKGKEATETEPAAAQRLVVPSSYEKILAIKDPADLQGALGPEEAILLIHRTAKGNAHFVLFGGGKTMSAVASIPYARRLDPVAYAEALKKSALAAVFPAKGARLYLVPSAELWEVPWETLNLDGQPLKQRNQLAFLPSPDALPAFKSHASILKASVGQVSNDPKNDAIQKANAARDFERIPLDGQVALGSRLAAFNLVHFDSTLRVNDVEPGSSAVVTADDTQPTGYRNDLTLKKLADLDLSSTSVLVFGSTERVNPDLMAGGEGHDGWLFVALSTAAAGVQAAVMSEPKNDWQAFYEKLTDRSVIEAAQAADLKGRVIGYGGIPGANEVAFAESQLESTTEEAEDAYDEGEYVDAIVAYKKLLYYATRTGKTDIEDQSLEALVKALFLRRDYAGALLYKKKVAAKLKPTPGAKDDKDPAEYGMAVVECAVLAVRALSFTEAEGYLAEAEAIFVAEEEPAQLGKIHQYRGINFENQKRYEETIASFKKSREIFQEVNQEQAAYRLLDIGSVYLNRYSNYAKALEYYSSAAEELKKLGKQEAYLPVLIDKANAQIATGDLAEAIGVLEREAIPTIDIATQRVLWIRANQSLANAYYRAGLYQESKDLNDRLLVEIQKIEDNLVRVDKQIDAMSLKGMVLAKLGQYKESFKEFKDGIALAREYNRKGQLALLYNNYGFWAREFGAVDPSIEFFTIALKIDEELKSPSGIAVDNRNMALSIVLKGDYNRARDLLTQSLKTSEELNMAYNIAYCHFGLGDVALREEKWEEAEGHFQRALGVSEKGFMQDFVWRAYGGIATALARQGKVEEAEKDFAAAAAVVETLRAGLKSEASRSAFMSDAGVQEMYEAYAVVLMKRGKVEAAWTASEKARSRAFMDSLGTQKIRFAKAESGELIDQEKERRATVEGIERKLSQAKGTPEEASLEKELEGAKSRYAEILQTMRADDGQLVQFVNVDAITKEELSQVLDPDTALVEYMVAPEALLVWVVRGGKVSGKLVPVTAKELGQSVRDFRMLMQNFSSPEYLGRELARWLIDPVKTELEGAKRLAVVPHGNLHFLSFAALPFGSDEFLIDRFPLYYLDSATLARYAHKRDGQSQLSKEARVLTFANPEIPGVNLPPVPFTGKEADVIPRYFPRTTGVEGNAASEATVRAAADQYDVLHIASHGEFLSTAPAKSKLLLAAGDGADGDLTVTEIFGMPLKANLVTLSACETGMGRISAGDEVIGMDRAFFYAGADTVVSSLWRISDVASAVTMKRFYRYLAEGKTKDEAMREAQLVVRRYFKHPAYWAAFRVLGDYQ